MQLIREMDKVTEEILSELRDLFDRHDNDGSGSLCIKELALLMRERGQNPTDDDIKAFMTKADKNGDDTVDVDEFVRIITEQEDFEHPEHFLIQAFKKFDTDNSGFLERDELKKVILKDPETVEADVDALLDMTDINGDGKVDIHELVALLQNQ